MTTPLIDDEHADLREEAPGSRWLGTTRRRWSVALAGAAAAVAIAVGAVVVLDGSGDDAGVATGPPLELSLGDSTVMASCLPFDVGILSGMSPAFAATATEVAGDIVTLQVDRWYAGGDAATVELHATPGMQALIDGFDFEVGQQYLITAAQGTVNFCGYSGPATPELTEAFDEAFGG